MVHETIYGIQKKNVKSFIFPSKNDEAYGDSHYHEIVCLGLNIS